MLKQALLRGCLSYCICVTVADFAALIVVLCGGQSTVPGFVIRAGGEIVAAFLQPLLIGWIGFAFAAGSVLFEIERWSFLQQGLAHLAVTLPVFIAVEFLCFGLSNVPALLSFAASAALSYAVTCLRNTSSGAARCASSTRRFGEGTPTAAERRAGGEVPFGRVLIARIGFRLREAFGISEGAKREPAGGSEERTGRADPARFTQGFIGRERTEPDECS